MSAAICRIQKKRKPRMSLRSSGLRLLSVLIFDYRHPHNAKPLKGFSGVLEIRDNFDGDKYRAVYTVRFEGVLSALKKEVLHAFQKKSTSGIATPQRHIELVRQRLTDAETIHQCDKGRPTMTTRKKLPTHEKGSGNIFADLGLPNAEEHQLKATLVVQLKRLIAARELTQTAAAKLIEMKQPDLSKLLRGEFRLVSVEKLMRMLTAFDQDVEITMKPHRKRGKPGRITFIATAT
jgi:predicted XRE-type DNA-binding protein/phage-related protein